MRRNPSAERSLVGRELFIELSDVFAAGERFVFFVELLAFIPKQWDMKVTVCPHYVINPYQQLLADSLGKLGWDVEHVKNHGTLGRKLRIDGEVLHLHWQPEYVHGRRFWINTVRFALAVLKGKWAGVKIVWTVHNAVPHESKNRWVDLAIGWLHFLVADRSICHSRFAKETAMALYGVGGESISVVPHGNYVGVYGNEVTREAARSELGLPETGVVVLFFGLIRPYKGVFDLIRAFKATAPATAQLVIAGKLFKVSEEEVKSEIGEDERIKLFAGRVEDDRLQVYFNASDVVAFPYKRSLTSGAAILAMSYGKACLAYRQAGMLSILDDRGAVFAELEGDATLETALRACFGQRDLKAAGDWNLRKSEDWNWDRVGRLTERVYRLRDTRVL